MRKHFLVYVLAGFGLASIISFALGEQRNYQDLVLETGECVSNLWQEHETRTGAMPTADMEREWWQKCKEKKDGKN